MLTMDQDTRSLPALVDLYLLRCAVEGKSPRTVAAYRWTLGRFLAALADDGAPLHPEQITPTHLYASAHSPWVIQRAR